MWEKAVFYFHQAGARAIARSAYREAAKFLEEALEILTRLPDTRDRLAQRLELRVTLGPALMAIRGAGGPEVEASYTDAHELCRRLDDSSHLFSVLWGLWYVNHSRGHYERACQIGEQLLALADKQQDPGLLLEADHSLWSDMTAMGRPVEADGYIAQGLRLYDRREHGTYAFLYGNHDPGVCGRTHAALTGWLRGFPDQAATRMHEGLCLATELGHPVTTMIAHYGASHMFYQRGDWRAAEETAETMVALGREQGISVWPEHGEMLLGRLRIEQGRNAEGLARLEKAFGPATAVGWTRFAIFSALLLADGYCRTGQPDKGLEILGRLATRRTQGVYEPELARLEGELLLVQGGDPAAAEVCFRRATAFAGERDLKSFELRAATSLARVLVIQGRREEARTRLDEVYGWFSEGFDTNDLQQARALQDELM
jgi:tetratricopeptide (TPR) repeat protein